MKRQFFWLAFVPFLVCDVGCSQSSKQADKKPVIQEDLDFQVDVDQSKAFDPNSETSKTKSDK